ncbi:glutamate synthase-related protein [Kribbella koreensis]|uniref:Glutamate synthase-related protein n=1 Tax=Kribbella koreensis TaxID=57909 RepID=A0ABN1PPW9_9ACTN
MAILHAETFPEAAVRSRAKTGAADAFPPADQYGHALFGAETGGPEPTCPIDRHRLVPPVFVPQRFAKLVELTREPVYRDVVLETTIGGFRSALPLYVSAFGSTEAASVALGISASRQAGRLGIPMVVGENVMPMNSYGRLEEDAERSLLGRISAYQAEALDGYGGVVVQQSTEDADAEVWNLVYSDPNALSLLESGRLAFELKVGQGAKPGLGGMTLMGAESAERLADAYLLDPVVGNGQVLRSSSPGSFTAEILKQQIRLMRNNYPRARIWVKLPPARDVAAAARVAWEAGADAVTVDGAEGGTGWAPRAFLDQVGLSLGECLRRIGEERAGREQPGLELAGATPTCLLVSGRMWEGARIAKSLALGANAAGLGRAALIAVDTDPDNGLVNLVECLALELQLIVSALGKYHVEALDREDVWSPVG